jgi:hypothetical protein
MSNRHVSRVTLGLVALVSVVTTVLAPMADTAGATVPLGNATASKYWVKVTGTMNQLPTVTEVISGDFFFGYTTGGYWYLSWFKPSKTYSYQEPVKDTFVVVTKKGVIQWVTDTFTANCGAVRGCNKHLVPMRFYVGKQGGYWGAIANGKTAPTCWVKGSGQTACIGEYFSWTGKHVWYPGGGPYEGRATVAPLKVSGPTTTITATYSYTSDGQKATEIDTTTTATHRITKATFTVAAGHKSTERAYHQSEGVTWSTKQPAVPTLRACP